MNSVSSLLSSACFSNPVQASLPTEKLQPTEPSGAPQQKGKPLLITALTSFGGDDLMVGLDDLSDLFQTPQFYDFGVIMDVEWFKTPLCNSVWSPKFFWQPIPQLCPTATAPQAPRATRKNHLDCALLLSRLWGIFWDFANPVDLGAKPTERQTYA